MQTKTLRCRGLCQDGTRCRRRSLHGSPLCCAHAPESIESLTLGTCSICMESFNQHLTLKLRCGHEFHRTCVGHWCANSFTCPLCRTQLRRKKVHRRKASNPAYHTNIAKEPAEIRILPKRSAKRRAQARINSVLDLENLSTTALQNSTTIWNAKHAPRSCLRQSSRSVIATKRF